MNRRVLCAAASAFAVLLFDLFFLLRPVLRLPELEKLRISSDLKKAIRSLGEGYGFRLEID